MNSIIIDDEATARTILKLLCSKIKDLNVIAEFDNVIDAAKFLEVKNVDVIFLDIHMKELSGFNLIDCLKSMDLNNLPQVIITTSDENSAFNAFQYNCSDYLLKPIELIRFKKSIDKVRKKINIVDTL